MGPRAGGSAVKIPHNPLWQSPHAMFSPSPEKGACKRSRGPYRAACTWFSNMFATGPRGAAVRPTGGHREGARHGAHPLNGPILGLVEPRMLAYLGKRRVKTAKLQTESFGSAPDLFCIDGRRYPTTQADLEALALAPSGKGGRVSLDPRRHSYQCRLLVDHTPPEELVSCGADGHADGTGAADRCDVER
jgi:general secretion pathway protein G